MSPDQPSPVSGFTVGAHINKRRDEEAGDADHAGAHAIANGLLATEMFIPVPAKSRGLGHLY